MVRMGKNKFTLIELLVVVAIIAILAGMLLPALNSARAKAQMSQCTSNLKTLGLFLQQYTNDYQDYITWAENAMFNDGKTRNWFQLLYLTNRNHQVFQCPADTLKVDKGSTSYRFCRLDNTFITPSIVSYMTNGSVCGWYMDDSNKNSTPRIGQFKTPSKTVYAVDEQGYRDFFVNGELNWVNMYKTVVTNMFIHNRSGNLLLLDGHVSSEHFTYADGWLKSYIWTK